MTHDPDKVYRVSVKLIGEDIDLLDKIARAQFSTREDVIRDALYSYYLALREQAKRRLGESIGEAFREDREPIDLPY